MELFKSHRIDTDSSPDAGLNHPRNSEVFNPSFRLRSTRQVWVYWKLCVSVGADPSLITQGFHVGNMCEPTWGGSNAQRHRLKVCGQGLIADCAHLNCTAQQGLNWCRITFSHILWQGIHHVRILNKDQDRFYFFTRVRSRRPNHLSVIRWEFCVFVFVVSVSVDDFCLFIHGSYCCS